MKSLLFPFIITTLYAGAINAATFKGKVKDAKTGEELIGATIFVKEDPTIGSVTGLDGSFILNRDSHLIPSI